ncbi:alternative oxidase [Thioalkalivibrio sp. ALJ7]|uniref:alternative oxidase n=1 Tax=Thioalkalivibrio sp. ALJ7 TaxID=1158756 RepID=UPI000371B9B0
MNDQDIDLSRHHEPRDFSDRAARGFTSLMRFFADTFFAGRYGHRAVVLETVAGVPGMVGATLQHLRSLRRMEDDHGWIAKLMDEAENERMHLLTFVEIASPNWLERLLIILAQGFFYTLYFMIYVVSSRTAHRIVGYFEEEAVVSYTEYLEEVESGAIEDLPAPDRAIQYWQLAEDARLSDVIRAVRNDEAGHRDVNHGFADLLRKKT